MFKICARCLLAICAALVPVSVFAQSAADFPVQGVTDDSTAVAQENQELRFRVDRLETLVDQLRHELNREPSMQALTELESQFLEPNESAVEHASLATLHLSDGGSHSTDIFPTVRLTGFFQADAGWVSQSDSNRVAVGDLQDGADFRRARLAATGMVAENVGYMLEMDFAFPGRPTFMDIWGELRNLDGLQNVRVGQYRQPFGLDGLTSVKELTFLERGLPFAFLPFRQIGAMAHGTSECEGMTWAVSGFRAQTDAFGANVGDDGYGLATRLTARHAGGSGETIHFGGACSVIAPTSDSVQYRNEPEFFVSDSISGATPFFVDTSLIAMETVHLFAGEVAATSGPWHGQGEIVYALVDRQTASSVVFSGASFQTGYILTGEHRPYDSKNAVLGRIVPHQNFGSDGGCGAWEIAARWSYLDLNDGGVNGGLLNDLTAGLNWYLNRNTKLQLNYVHAFLKTQGQGDSDADVVAMRAQIDF